jgi:hypothetical protein
MEERAPPAMWSCPLELLLGLQLWSESPSDPKIGLCSQNCLIAGISQADDADRPLKSRGQAKALNLGCIFRRGRAQFHC